MTQKDYEGLVVGLKLVLNQFHQGRIIRDQLWAYDRLNFIINYCLSRPHMLGQKWQDFFDLFYTGIEQKTNVPLNIISEPRKTGVAELRLVYEYRELFFSLLAEFCEPLIEKATEEPKEVQNAAKA